MGKVNDGFIFCNKFLEMSKYLIVIHQNVCVRVCISFFFFLSLFVYLNILFLKLSQLKHFFRKENIYYSIINIKYILKNI